MAIDYTTPTIAPPGAEEVASVDPDFPAVDQYATEQDAPDYDATDDLGGYLSKASKAGIESPSRYSSPIIQQGLDLIRQQGQTAEEQSMATLGERMTQRGLVGSGIEASRQTAQRGPISRYRLGHKSFKNRAWTLTMRSVKPSWNNRSISSARQRQSANHSSRPHCPSNKPHA